MDAGGELSRFKTQRNHIDQLLAAGGDTVEDKAAPKLAMASLDKTSQGKGKAPTLR